MRKDPQPVNLEDLSQFKQVPKKLIFNNLSPTTGLGNDKQEHSDPVVHATRQALQRVLREVQEDEGLLRNPVQQVLCAARSLPVDRQPDPEQRGQDLREVGLPSDQRHLEAQVRLKVVGQLLGLPEDTGKHP